ncbi:lipid-A-disaccharide synthase [Methyloferula stellata]|uniref:lipid-A-disaccharide synthase n=1 Tax=Methyloferula stellata TaxID=876270 RepID=UPI00036072BD|nr:lipid-A-disaccharide synthase [Methyloferula stellata]
MTRAGLKREAKRAAMKVFLVAGEESGDQLGAGLMRALRARQPGVVTAGVGGTAMAKEGLESLFPMDDIAVMGFVSVIARLPLLVKRIGETAEAALRFEPDVLAIIDSPDFTHRVARRLRAARPDLPIVDYVSPTVWAWRPGRAAQMRRSIDHVLALLPFEPEAHRRLGGPACSYVGHPLIERLDVLTPNEDEMRARSADPPLVLVLPGSRRSEVTRLLDDFGAAIGLIRSTFGPVEVVLPAVPHLEALIRARVADWPWPPRIVTGEAEKFAAFRRARAALAASGTVTLELALASVPQCVAYKVSWAEGFLKYVITVPSIVLPNLILGENVVPEFLQEACTPHKLAGAMVALLRDGPDREAQIAAFQRLKELMSLADGESPAGRAAEIVIKAGSQRS